MSVFLWGGVAMWVPDSAARAPSSAARSRAQGRRGSDREGLTHAKSPPLTTGALAQIDGPATHTLDAAERWREDSALFAVRIISITENCMYTHFIIQSPDRCSLSY